MDRSRSLSSEEQAGLLATLKARFERNRRRHERIEWSGVAAELEANPEKLWTLAQMERTGGEPDVVVLGEETAFVDCAAESPKGRRSLCYDRAALDARKEAKPENSAVDVAVEMGVDILTEAQYRALQGLGEFDLKTSSWIATPEKVRGLGGALFCDRRYDTVFTFHNGAESYYASRGFRGSLRIARQ